MPKTSLKILMVSNLDVTSFYGQTIRPYYLGRYLSDRDTMILHACPNPPNSEGHTSFIPMRTSTRMSRILSMIRIGTQSVLFNPNVVYVHQFGGAARVARRFCRIMRKPLVLDVHGSPTQEDLARGGVNINELNSTELAEKEALDSADKVIVVSQELKAFYQSRFDVPESRVVIVPNGVDLRPFRRARSESEKDSTRKALQIPDGNRVVTFTCPRITFPSNEIALKWFFGVVEIVEGQRKDVTFLVLGGGKVIPAPTSLMYTGFVEDLPAALDISDVCVLPYPPNAICGGTRNKTIEYLAAVKPIVSTSEGMRGFDEVVPGRDYLLATTPQEFAEKILSLLADESLATRVTSRSSLLADEYDWARLGDRVYSVFLSCAT